jgi:hypothetical protein
MNPARDSAGGLLAARGKQGSIWPETPAKRNAKALKRTEGATRQKAFSIGLSLDTRM